MSQISLDIRNKNLDELERNVRGLSWVDVGDQVVQLLARCRPDDRSVHDTWSILAKNITDPLERLRLLRAMIELQPIYNKWRPIEAFAKYLDSDAVGVLFNDFRVSSLQHRGMSLNLQVLKISQEYWFYTPALAALAARCNAFGLILEFADDPAVCVVGVMAIAMECNRHHFARVEACEELFEECKPKLAAIEAVSVEIELRYSKWHELWGIGALWDCLTVDGSKYLPYLREREVVRRYLKDVGVK
jgi:hypothetical protein